jgi:hypothetical protein
MVDVGEGRRSLPPSSRGSVATRSRAASYGAVALPELDLEMLEEFKKGVEMMKGMDGAVSVTSDGTK